MLKIGVLDDDSQIASQVLCDILSKDNKKFHFKKTITEDDIRNGFVEAVFNKAKILLIDLNSESDFEKIASLKFDILLFLAKKNKNQVILKSLLKQNNFLIINSDNPWVKKIITNTNTSLITCGFSSNASITISSVDCQFTNKLQICLQRTLETYGGEEIEPQEIIFSRQYNNENIINIIAAVAAALLSGAKV